MSSYGIEEWTWDILDLTDQLITTVDTMETGGIIELNVNADLRGGGRFTMRQGASDIDWLKVRLRPWSHDLTTGMSLPWGVYIPVVSQADISPKGRSWSGTIVDKTSILNASGPLETYSVASGTQIIPLVVSIIQEQADSRIASTPSDATTSGMMTWDSDATWLRIINDLLDAAHYFAISTDRWGQWRIDPYVLPASRGVRHAFTPGIDSIHLPSFASVRDETNVPNRVRCIGQADGENQPLVGVAINENPLSRYSVQQRGRIIEKRYDNVEASDQATLNAIAQRRLVEASSPGQTMEGVTHRVVDLWLNDVVRFSDGGVETLATVDKMTVTCTPGKLVESAFRGVADL